jgi:hypothetical protein
MDNKKMERFAALPRDILHHVLDYYGKIIYVRGIYISSLPHEDPRYQLLSTIPRTVPMYGKDYWPLFRGHFQSKVAFKGNTYRMFWYNVNNVTDKIFFFWYKSNTNGDMLCSQQWLRT